MLCERCQKLQILREEPDSAATRELVVVNAQTLANSAWAGCTICTLLYNGFVWYNRISGETVSDDVCFFLQFLSMRPLLHGVRAIGMVKSKAGTGWNFIHYQVCVKTHIPISPAIQAGTQILSIISFLASSYTKGRRFTHPIISSSKNLFDILM
jgi:hypothetical protein